MATGRPHRVFVHVGLPKTGTTFLQDLMRQHRAALQSVGVCYPDDGHRDHFFAALDARGDHVFAGGVRPAARGAWPRLVKLALACEGTVVLGHEILATAPPDQARAALAALDGVEVHVVATARDPARQVVADWQESIKHGRRLRFAAYVGKAGLGGQDDSESETGPVPFRGQQLAEVLDSWGGALPAERVHVVTVPPAGTQPALLWHRFADTIGIADPARFPPGDEVRANPSLGVADIEVMRRVSTFLDSRLVASEFGAVAKNLYAQRILAQVSRTPAPVPPADLMPTLEALAERWIAAVTERGYTVHGDLKELRPGAVAGRGPEDWDMEEALDTATAATAELLLEVARLRRECAAAPRGVLRHRRLRKAARAGLTRMLRRR
ncbi:MAG: hypothetical protein H0V48_06920 [Nocardioidaceae bacterium]|nr:hypothetical protein [Nocardioidaceae bacterium]